MAAWAAARISGCRGRGFLVALGTPSPVRAVERVRIGSATHHRFQNKGPLSPSRISKARGSVLALVVGGTSWSRGEGERFRPIMGRAEEEATDSVRASSGAAFLPSASPGTNPCNLNPEKLQVSSLICGVQGSPLTSSFSKPCFLLAPLLPSKVSSFVVLLPLLPPLSVSSTSCCWTALAPRLV